MRLKSKLKVLLVERDITQKEFAEKVGISSSAMNKLCNKHSLPEFMTAYRISEELNMDIREIWIREDEQQ